MSRSAVPTVSNGDSWSAAQQNTYLRDNEAAHWPYTTAGDMAYATGAADLARLAKPSVEAVMKNDNGGVPSWLTITQMFPVVATHNNATGHSYTTAVTWRDMPNSSASITPARTSTIVVFGIVVNYGSNTYGERQFKFNIDGSDIDTHVSHESYQLNEWVSTPIIGFKTGVSSGSRTIKLREYVDAGGFTVERLFWIAVAIPE